MNEILSWKPFRAKYVSYDGRPTTVTFRCPNCGSRNCDRRTRHTNNRVDDRHFWQGSYRCSSCGVESEKDGGSIYYASECFIKTTDEVCIQQSLFD